MLIHGDGNSNIKFGSCFDCKDFIKKADPDIILMNPPYNAKPIGIPEKYKSDWGKAKDGKEDPTKGLVFIHFLSDEIKKMTVERISVENIRLPIQHNPDGTPYIDPNHTYSEDGYVPDWQYMEEYIKSLPYGDRV